MTCIGGSLLTITISLQWVIYQEQDHLNLFEMSTQDIKDRYKSIGSKPKVKAKLYYIINVGNTSLTMALYKKLKLIKKLL